MKLVSSFFEFIIDVLVSGLKDTVSAAMIVFFSILFLYFYYRYKNEKYVSPNVFLSSFLSKLLLDKIDMGIFNNQENEEPDIVCDEKNSGYDDKTESSYGEQINGIDNQTETSRINQQLISIPYVSYVEENNSVKIMNKKSKNYGSDAKYSIRTWFGVNYNKLKNYDYICFNAGDVEKIYVHVEDFIKLIDSEITKDEKDKYIKRNSFDTYLMKSKEDHKWYITRLGTNLKEPIIMVHDTV